MILHRAVRKLYSNAGKVSGDDFSNLIAFDSNDNQINLDIEQVKISFDQIQAEENKNIYKEKRAAEYPDFRDYLDGIVKGDQAQIQAYIDACLAVKAKYPKGGA